MEAESAEESSSLPWVRSSQSSGRETEDEEAAEPARTSPTAGEVEEEIILPASTSLGSEEDTILPRSTSFEAEDLPETSLPPSSESPDPPGPSPSDPSSAPPGSSSPAFSSPLASPSTSPLSWKASCHRLQQLLEEEEEGRGEQAGARAGLSPGGQAQQKKAKKKGPPAKKGAPSQSAGRPGPLGQGSGPPGSGDGTRPGDCWRGRRERWGRGVLAELLLAGRRGPVGGQAPLPTGYTVRAIVPAEKEELVSVAKAMHHEKFAKNVKELFHLEKEAALKSIQTGLYIGWRCPEYLWDCFRVGDESRCFCGHLLKLHQVYVEKRATVPCTVADCRCQGFVFIPSCPEEVGEFWLRRRTGFDVAAWRAKCRCKHTHEDHMPIGARGCCVRGCSCVAFTSSFLCAACDRRWEEHETFFESEETRRKGGRPCGEAYLPFAELPELRNAVLKGHCEEPSASWALPGQACQALPAPSGSRALPLPPPGPRRLVQKDDKKA
ncbi:protein FAM221B [Candoia aspera]|uniref:protein FAM221B n=1 Tax=Candoia aspera TaxID=51853 RepID=UPI002FD82372